MENRLTRIGVFYDGNFFSRISSFYNYHHERRASISVTGLHELLKTEICRIEGGNLNYYKIVDAHYFRGRLSAIRAKEQNTLYRARVFDETLINAGVVTHYLPISAYSNNGIDVYLALEAFELSSYMKFDVVILIASGSEYVSLIRKLNTLGVKVMVLGWNIKYLNEQGEEQTTMTAQALLDEATYPFMMNTVVEGKTGQRNALIENLFVKAVAGNKAVEEQEAVTVNVPMSDDVAGKGLPLEFGFMKPPEFREQSDHDITGKVLTLENGVGIIKSDTGEDNAFFHYKEIQNVDFNELKEGDHLIYQVVKIGKTNVAKRIRLMQRETDKLS